MPSIFIESSSFFAGSKDNYIVSNEFEILPDPTIDCRVTVIDQFKNFFENYSKYFNDLLPGERLLPFGLLDYMSFYLSLQLMKPFR